MPEIELPCGVTVICDPEDEEYIRSKSWALYDRNYKRHRGEYMDLSRLEYVTFATGKLTGKERTWFEARARRKVKTRNHRTFLIREIGFRKDPRWRAFAETVQFSAINGNRFDVRRSNITHKFNYFVLASKLRFYDAFLEERWKDWYGFGRGAGW